MLRKKKAAPAKTVKAEATAEKKPHAPAIKTKTTLGERLKAVRFRGGKQRKLPNAYRLFIQACQVPVRHWEIFGGILLLYAAVNALLIGGLTGGTDLEALKTGLNEAFTGQFAKLTTGLALFGFLITDGPSNAASGVASAYQTFSLLLISLALIWALRQVYAGHTIRVRDAFYNGMAPLVPFLLVMLYIGLQLLPAVIGGLIFTALVGTGILQQWYEIAIVSGILFVGVVSSLYMLLSSVFALYIVTLPDMTPWKALQSAKDIVRGRRGNVFRKLIFLPLAVVLCAAVLMVPLSLLLTPIAPYVFFVLTIAVIAVVHSYMYAVYRELIA